MTTLEILAPFLPYGIDIETSIGRCRILELDLRPGATAPVSAALSQDVEDDWWVTEYFAYDHVTPVLRSFADLCTPLADGTVPAVEVAKLAVWVPAELDQPDYLWQHAEAGHDEDEYGNEYVCVRLGKAGGANDLLYIFSHWDVVTPNGFSNQLPVFDYLRRHHFALPVNGQLLVEGPDYIRKDAAV